LRKVSSALGLSRNIGDTRDAFPQMRVFKIPEEEHSISDDGPSDGASELFAVVIRRAFVGWSKDVSGLERFCPEKAISRAVPGVRSGLRHDIDLSRSIASEGSV